MKKENFCIIILLFLCTVTTSIAGDFKARHIELKSTATGTGSSFHRYRGSVTIVPWTPQKAFSAFIELSISGLPCVPWSGNSSDPVNTGGENFYTLFMESTSYGKIRITNFNTSCTAGVFHMDTFLPRDLYSSWFTDSLRITVESMLDDGNHGNDQEVFVRLRGVDCINGEQCFLE